METHMPKQPKEDLSISKLRANMIAFIIALPIAILQIGGNKTIFRQTHYITIEVRGKTPNFNGYIVRLAYEEAVDISAYQMGGLTPRLILGIIPYICSLILGDSNLLWFGIIHTIAANGDWQVLWLIRKVRHGSQVEDHPTRAGCYVIAP
ncbi:MAG: metalloprotease family protein [Chloroflexota bacterium]|jgi:hypothetical protein|nr:DUF3267 domain-containing protein [Chloroflexota bacterium]